MGMARNAPGMQARSALFMAGTARCNRAIIGSFYLPIKARRSNRSRASESSAILSRAADR